MDAIYNRAINSLIGYSYSLIEQKELACNLIKYNAPNPSEQTQLAPIERHEFVYLSYEDDEGPAVILDGTDLLEAVYNATSTNVSLDITVTVDPVVCTVEEVTSERIHLEVPLHLEPHITP